MIPQTAITHWRNIAPWPRESQIEQDLILSRALVEMFRDPLVAREATLRGGTAIHKLFVKKPLRYSEDIDLVQITAGPIGPLLNAIRSKVDPVLGKPSWEKKKASVKLMYRMESEIPPIVRLRLKIEINTREHFAVFGAVEHPLRIKSPWFEGNAAVKTYTLDELLATKLRALYQRRKGRDLFDLWVGLRMKGTEPRRIVDAFRQYLKAGRQGISRKEFEKNLAAKVVSRQFNDDLSPLLAPKVNYDAKRAARLITRKLIALL